jgi:hypothetical protein
VSATAAENLRSPTPILDREAPLPAPVNRDPSKALVLVIWLACVVATVAFYPVLKRWMDAHHVDDFLMSWSGPRIIVLGVLLVTVYWARIAIHEGGHVLGGLAVGFRFQSVRVGPVMVDRPFRLSHYRGLGAAAGGAAQMLPLTTDGLATRAIIMVLAGPAANLLSGALLLILPLPKGPFFWVFIVLSILTGMGELVPFEGKLGVSDGRRIAMLLGRGERGERWLAVMKLTADLVIGRPPDKLSPAFLARAIAVRDNSADTVTGHAYAHTAAMYRGELDRAGELLEVCLTYAGYVSPAMREALMSDAGIYLARHRKRPDLAQKWLADMPESTRRPWLRARVEASILEAKGDREGAALRIDAVEKALLALPNVLQRRLVLEPLQKWRAQLRG